MEIDKIRDELAAEHTRHCSAQMLPGSFIDGFNAAIRMLEGMAGEFPQATADKWGKGYRNYILGRRHQYAEDQARIGLAEIKAKKGVDT